MRLLSPFAQFDNDGEPLSNGWLHFLEPGSVDTPKSVYADSAEGVPLANPVQLDSEGQAPAIFGTGTYKVVLYANDPVTNEPGTQLRVEEPVGGSLQSNDFGSWNPNSLYSIAAIVKAEDGAFYESIVADNQNNNPLDSPEHWKKIRFDEYWNENITYNTGSRVLYEDTGFAYISIVDDNTGNDPTLTIDTHWINEAAEAAGAEVAALVTAEGSAQIALVTAEGDTQAARVEDEGDTQYWRVLSVGASQLANANLRQGVLSSPGFTATPSTVKVAATKTGNLTSTYHDLGLDMLTGSRSGMTLSKIRTSSLGTILQSGIFGHGNYLQTDLTIALSALTDAVLQHTSDGVQIGVNTYHSDTNILALATVKKKFMPDGSYWEYNPESGFAQFMYTGNATARTLLSPIGAEPMFFSIKDTSSTNSFVTGRSGTKNGMILSATTIEQDIGVWSAAPTDLGINLAAAASPVNSNGVKYFGFGFFGDDLSDITLGMLGKRGVTAMVAGDYSNVPIETGINDIQAIIIKVISGSGSGWYFFNAASGWGKYTYLNSTAAELTNGATVLTVDGSVITPSANFTSDIMVLAIGGTANRPDTQIKEASANVRKYGTSAANHRVDLGHDFSTGDNGGIVLAKAVGLAGHTFVFDTIIGAGGNLLTSSDAAEQTTTEFEGFTTTGVDVGNNANFNSTSYINQFTVFPTNEKITTSDGLVWNVNRKLGFGFCEYIGDGLNGHELQLPLGKQLVQAWFKGKSTTSTWYVWNHTMGDQIMFLNQTSAAVAAIGNGVFTELPDDTSIKLGTTYPVNGDGLTVTLYCWFGDDLGNGVWGTEGASAFWTQTGSASVDTKIPNIGNVLTKATSTTGDWNLTNTSFGMAYALNATAVESASVFNISGQVITLDYAVDTALTAVFAEGVESGIDDQLILSATTSNPFIATLANGFAGGSPVDIPAVIDETISMTITGSAGKKYIYVDADGVLRFTDKKPSYVRTDYPVHIDWVYDILGTKMRLDGVVTPAVFAAECSLDEDGNVFNIVNYTVGNVWASERMAALSYLTYNIPVNFGHDEVELTVIGVNADGSVRPFVYYEASGVYYGALYNYNEGELEIITYVVSQAELYCLARRTF